MIKEIVIKALHTYIAYLKWLPKTFHLHGIHSPFIFHLEREVLRRHSLPQFKHELKKYQTRLLQDDTNAALVNAIAGQQQVNCNTKERPCAKTIPIERLLLLQRMTAYFKPQNVLELSSSLGLTTLSLAIDSTAEVKSVRENAIIAQTAERHLTESGYINCKIHNATFESALEDIAHDNFDFVYIDVGCDSNKLLTYVTRLVLLATDNTVWVISNIHRSQDMSKAWRFIKSKGLISATIDCFAFGIVFFRPQQAKEDFFIRL